MIAPVVSRQWLAEHRGDVVLVDVRREVPGLSAAAAFEQGHRPGAVLVDLDRWLAGPRSSPVSPGRSEPSSRPAS